MDFSSIPLFNLMRAQLNYLSERQNVLAQNVANADTPGYRAMDVTAPDFTKLVAGNAPQPQNLQMAITSPMDMSGNAGDGSSYKVAQRPFTDEMKPDGNNVDLEEEMSKVAVNQADYQKVLGLYTKAIAMFKTAIGSAGSGG